MLQVAQYNYKQVVCQYWFDPPSHLVYYVVSNAYHEKIEYRSELPDGSIASIETDKTTREFLSFSLLTHWGKVRRDCQYTLTISPSTTTSCVPALRGEDLDYALFSESSNKSTFVGCFDYSVYFNANKNMIVQFSNNYDKVINVNNRIYFGLIGNFLSHIEMIFDDNSVVEGFKPYDDSLSLT